VGFVIDILRV